MAPSQLKQLKASLRENGVLGPQQSKKQKQKNAKSGAAAANRIQRNAVLERVREQFNPFEVRAPARPAKFSSTSRSDQEAPRARPGVTKSLGEQRRKETLLKEMQRRSKVGTLLDRRFGENDPTMTPEERAAERFARESQKKLKKESMFNLEDDEEELQLTHLGQTLTFDKEGGDDFQEDDLGGSDEDGESEVARKRRRVVEEDDMEGMADDSEEEGQPERKKSKNEVMKELIAKSKFHKYERQKAKEDDDDLRETLDKGLPEIFEIMRGVKKPEPQPEPQPDLATTMNPDRAALLNGKDRDQADKEYDQRLKQMTYDKRAKPLDRTKTEEEKAEEEAERLRQLEKERLRRMQGEKDESEEEEDNDGDKDMEDESEPDDAKAFGLVQPNTMPELGVEDEDDFIIDSDLVESDSEADLSLDESDLASSADEEEAEEEEDDEFIGGLVLPPDAKGDHKPAAINGKPSATSGNQSLAFTYPCPESHEHFLQVIKDATAEDLPTVVQRIRALHHPRLHPDNKAKLATFSKVLVQHTAYLANQPNHPPFAILENLLRHIHSMAKAQPEAVATAVRNHLREMSENRPLELLPGDLVVLTGVATIFPTSDHFHAVVTPSMLSIARYLGQSSITNLGNIATGAYIATLCMQYQTFAKRYIPEFMNYILNVLCMLAPSEPKNSLGFFPIRNPSISLHLSPSKLSSASIRKLAFWDILFDSGDAAEQETLKLSLISTLITLLDQAADLWSSKSAFTDIFSPADRVLRHLNKSLAAKAPTTLSDQLQKTRDKLQMLMKQSDLKRRPLLLHNHRPLAIKAAIPKFEESFNPFRHYDPDRERAELNKLKAEHKRERKGAMRELRKDANFIARESLREKREKDAEYERKYRRLVAEIQGEEGRESNAYEREKRARKSKK